MQCRQKRQKCNNNNHNTTKLIPADCHQVVLNCGIIEREGANTSTMTTPPTPLTLQDPETGDYGAASVDQMVSNLNSPSDERLPHDEDHDDDDDGAQQGYHSIPESGDALNIGFVSALWNYNNSGPLSGVMKALEMQPTATTTSTSTGFQRFIVHTKSTFMAFVERSLKSKTIVEACYLGIAAMLGTLLRLILAQLFGQACSNPGTIGWIADDAALCVTASGQASQQGGIIFADMPANILGSFLMGLFQDGSSLDLAIHVPLAFLHPANALQAYDVLHLAIKTGFCGSLTTFSGWNSEMVIMLVGREATHRPSQVWKALLGYIVGIETALGSYVFGRTVAWWLHQWQNPDLALEQEAMKIRKYQHGIAINHSLPTLERRYLHGLFELPDTTDTSLVPPEDAHRLSPSNNLTPDELSPLHRWRESTKVSRRVESGLSDSLMELETTLIVRKERLSDEIRQTATANGWDVSSLEEWLSKRYHPQANEAESFAVSQQIQNLNSAGIQKSLTEEGTIWYSLPVAALCWIICMVILAVLMIYWDAETAYDITYRTMAYSMVYSTPGALLRWTLSGWNGKVDSLNWKWLPVGTLAANVVGAMVSISMMAWEYNLQVANATGFWGIATLRAIKIGFSGCLTTVSTFISEVHKLTLTRQDRGYKYIIITLVTSCVVSMILFVVIV
jgi:fluoride ion exporter CrcB/FEX